MESSNEAGHQRSRKRKKLIVVAALLFALTVVCAVGYVANSRLGWSAQERNRLPSLAEHRGDELRRLAVIGELQRPLGVAVNRAGDRVYVTESDGERQIKLFDDRGRLLKSFFPPDTGANDRFPTYVAVSPQGKVYVTDRQRRVIDVFSTGGDYLGTFPPDGSPSDDWAPLGVNVDPDGNVIVTDTGRESHRVIVFDPSGIEKLSFEGNMAYPTGIGTDSRGDYYVSDSGNARILKFTHDGEFEAVLAAGDKTLRLPRGIGVDGVDRLFVVDTLEDTVYVFDLNDGMRFLFELGESSPEGGDFLIPNSLAIDSAGRVYVADRDNSQVQVWGY